MKKETDLFLKSHEMAESVVCQLKDGIKTDQLDGFFEDAEERDEFRARFTNYASKQQIMEEIKSKNKKNDSQRLSEKLIVCKKTSQPRKKIVLAVSAVAAVFIAATLLIWTNEGQRSLQYTEKLQNEEFSVPTIITKNRQVEITNSIVETDFTVENGMLTYRNVITDIAVNELIIPPGFIQTILLEDGTEIMLNAQSRLIFPNKFSDTIREVELRGEAFFKVAKSNRPFVVKTDCGNVTVYGTEFNVYSKGEIFETLLVEGSVGVTIKEKGEVLITPNTFISYDNLSGNLIQKEVNAETYIGWIDGQFRYDDQSVARVLSDISNWFNVSFVYDKELGDKSVSMSMHKEANLKDVLSFLEIVLNRKFILEERGSYKVVK